MNLATPFCLRLYGGKNPLVLMFFCNTGNFRQTLVTDGRKNLGRWKSVCVRVILVSSKFGKVLTLQPKLPLNCEFSNKGKFPLHSYRTEKSTCWFRLALDKEASSHDAQLADYGQLACLMTCSGALTPDENVISTVMTETNVLGNIFRSS